MPFTIPDRVKTLPWKLDDVVIPVKSLSSGGFVVDPIGNVILHYSGEVDGKKLLADLKKLLGASKIG